MALEHKRDERGLFNPVLPNIEDWPICRISRKRSVFIQKLITNTVGHVYEYSDNDPQKVHEELAKVLYRERIRVKTEPWRVDPPDEKTFWKNVQNTLIETSLQLKKTNVSKIDAEEEICKEIISRYAIEIASHFEPSAYKKAAKILPRLFHRLLNTASNSTWKRLWANSFKLGERLKLTGPLEKIRELSLKGTIVLVPTHFSNLDPTLVGWAMYCLGLPAFLYGAGLNLFNSRLFEKLMTPLGPYKLDRRKKNPLYMETLKMYSRMMIEENVNSLFFPGGTRSRSGQVETKLKLGLLGTVIDAQRLNFINQDKPTKIFIVPLVINYHFVLEAASLIDEHLKRSGKERYFIEKDDFPSLRKIFMFLWKFLAARSEIILSLAEPMDVFANKVNIEGKSLDSHGKEIDIQGYFISNGQATKDAQRENEYTRILSEAIVKKYYQVNTVLSSHLVAFTAFILLERRHRRLDLYGLLRLPEEDREIPYLQFVKIITRLQKELRVMESDNKLQLANHMYGDVHRLIQHGIRNLGIYHAKNPLKKNSEGNITSEDMNMLYYYHNRLKGYELEKLI